MKKQMLIVLVMLFATFAGFGIVIPVLPVMIQQTGAAEFHLGLMLAAYSAISFLMSPYWGGLSDRIGRRPVLIVGTLGFSIGFLLFGLSSGHLWLMYASRIFSGFFAGAVASVAVAYVADLTTEENRTKGMGMVGMSIGLGFIFGPAIGGILSQSGEVVPFYAASGLAFVTFLFACVYLKESLSEQQRQNAASEKASRWSAFKGPVSYLYVLAFLVTFTLAGLESTLQYFQMRAFGASPEDVGYMFLATGIVGALIQGGVVRRYIKQGSEGKVIVIGLIISAAGFFLLLLSDSLLTASIYLSVFGAGNALVKPCVTSLITQKTTVGQGVTSGLASSMDSLGRIAGPLLATAVYQVHINLPFMIGGIICLLAILLHVRFKALDAANKQVHPAA